MTRHALAALLVSATTPAFAQPSDTLPREAERADPAVRDVVYPANFYDAFQPQTALDMLARTPGFSLDAGGEARGFGGNAGNVLINGQRPTVKTGGIEANLTRISAASVERIELVRGARTADAAGKTVVANIILRADAGGSGNASLEARRAPGDGEITPRVELNYTLPLAGWQVSAGLIGWYENNPRDGRYRLSSPAGALIASAAERFDQRYSGGTLNASLSGDLIGGTLSLNGLLGKERETYLRTFRPLSGDYEASDLNGVFDERKNELGGDWTRPLGKDWTSKLVGLWRTVDAEFGETSAGAGGIDAFAQRNRTTELVARVTAQRQGNHDILPEVGGEIASNALNSRFRGDVDGPAELVRVRELRAEAFANVTIRLIPALRLEAGIAFERSRISVEGGELPPRNLSYWKPSAALVWDIGKETQLRVAMRRDVGQLDFEAFAASGDLINNRPIAGNGDLRPEVTTRWSATLDHRFGQGGALSLTLAHEAIKDGLAYVPLDLGGQARANFGDVRLWRLEGQFAVPVDRIVKGARVTVKGDVAKTSRIDPVTGARRRDAREDNQIEFEWRHDLPKARSAWGFTAKLTLPLREWFIDEYQYERFAPYVSAYVETMLPYSVKAKLTASGLTGETENRRIDFYAPDRRGARSALEHRRREAGTYLNLLLSRQF